MRYFFSCRLVVVSCWGARGLINRRDMLLSYSVYYLLKTLAYNVYQYLSVCGGKNQVCWMRERVQLPTEPKYLYVTRKVQLISPAETPSDEAGRFEFGS